jgi:SAM-dependent methyltransferase
MSSLLLYHDKIALQNHPYISKQQHPQILLFKAPFLLWLFIGILDLVVAKLFLNMVLTKTQAQTQEKIKAKQKFYQSYQQGEPSINLLIEFIQLLYDDDGPLPSDYQPLNEALNYYRANIPSDLWKKSSAKIAAIFGEDFIDSIPGHAYLKPYGYAGDFEIIDKMYLKTTSSNPKLTKWDLFYHQHAAAAAVRNRKTFFKTVLAERASQTAGTCEVLDVASGPCRDILEYYEEQGTTGVNFDCVEADLKAILHATKINYKFLPHITFYNKNIFRFQTEKKYDLIWSAGLFDYFDDKTFVRLVSRLCNYIKPGGELIIGNFAVGNPTEGYMESFLDWYLYHRSPEQLIQLAKATGNTAIKNIKIDQEAAGVNLFMRIQF